MIELAKTDKELANDINSTIPNAQEFLDVLNKASASEKEKDPIVDFLARVQSADGF